MPSYEDNAIPNGGHPTVESRRRVIGLTRVGDQHLAARGALLVLAVQAGDPVGSDAVAALVQMVSRQARTLSRSIFLLRAI